MGAEAVIEPHYTTQELADLLSVNPETIRRAAASGELSSVRVGRVRRYALSAVEAWLSAALKGKQREHPQARQALLPSTRGSVRANGADA
jgi:excisionase family DNA binding protein